MTDTIGEVEVLRPRRLDAGISINFTKATVYTLGDKWVWTAIGTSNQVRTFNADSTNDSVYMNGALAVGQNANPVASAALEVESTTKGILPPRMTTTQKNNISAPATGLVVYDSTLSRLYVNY